MFAITVIVQRFFSFDKHHPTAEMLANQVQSNSILVVVCCCYSVILGLPDKSKKGVR